MIKHINILGQKYDVYFVGESEMPMQDTLGVCDRYSKEIFINEDGFVGEDVTKYPELAKAKTIRHEVIHAFLHECGLDSYTEDETIVDALAVLYPRMQKVFSELEVEQ